MIHRRFESGRNENFQNLDLFHPTTRHQICEFLFGSYSTLLDDIQCSWIARKGSREGWSVFLWANDRPPFRAPPEMWMIKAPNRGYDFQCIRDLKKGYHLELSIITSRYNSERKKGITNKP